MSKESDECINFACRSLGTSTHERYVLLNPGQLRLLNFMLAPSDYPKTLDAIRMYMESANLPKLTPSDLTSILSVARDYVS